MSTMWQSKMGTAGLLLAFSLLLLVEGVSRVNLHSSPMGSWAGDESTFPPIVLLVAAVGEVVFASYGVAVAIFQLFHGVGSPAVTFGLLLTEGILGWFTLASYVFASPAFAAARAPAAPGLTASQSSGVQILGLLGSIAVCFSLQGGQFFFSLKLLHLQKGAGEQYAGGAYYRSRMPLYCFFVVLKGACEVALGGIGLTALGAGPYSPPIISPPYVGTFGALNVADGIVVILFGLAGIAISVLDLRRAGAAYTTAALAILLTQLALYDMAAISQAPPAAIVGALQVVLTSALMLMPAYFAAGMGAEAGKAVGGAMAGSAV